LKRRIKVFAALPKFGKLQVLALYVLIEIKHNSISAATLLKIVSAAVFQKQIVAYAIFAVMDIIYLINLLG